MQAIQRIALALFSFLAASVLELIAAGLRGNKTIVELAIDQPNGTSVSAQPVDLYFK